MKPCWQLYQHQDARIPDHCVPSLSSWQTCLFQRLCFTATGTSVDHSQSKAQYSQSHTQSESHGHSQGHWQRRWQWIIQTLCEPRDAYTTSDEEVESPKAATLQAGPWVGVFDQLISYLWKSTTIILMGFVRPLFRQNDQCLRWLARGESGHRGFAAPRLHSLVFHQRLFHHWSPGPSNGEACHPRSLRNENPASWTQTKSRRMDNRDLLKQTSLRVELVATRLKPKPGYQKVQPKSMVYQRPMEYGMSKLPCHSHPLWLSMIKHG